MTSESFPHQPGAFVPPAEGGWTAGRGRGLRTISRFQKEQIHPPANSTDVVGDGRMRDKLKALVQVDVAGSQARIRIRGAVNSRNVMALYIMARRANSLAPDLDIVLDLKRATVQPEVMDQLLECAEARQLPVRVDPDRSECRLSITPAARLARTPTGLALAA